MLDFITIVILLIYYFIVIQQFFLRNLLVYCFEKSNNIISHLYRQAFVNNYMSLNNLRI